MRHRRFPPSSIRGILGESAIDPGTAYENWVFSELLKWKQLQSPEPDLWFYRTMAGMEVDFVLQAGNRLCPIEVKFREEVRASDGRAVERFLEEYATSASWGLVIHPGKEPAQLRPRVWGVPDWYLFGGLGETASR